VTREKVINRSFRVPPPLRAGPIPWSISRSRGQTLIPKLDRPYSFDQTSSSSAQFPQKPYQHLQSKYTCITVLYKMLRAILPTLRTALPRPIVARAIALPARPQAVRFYAASSGLNKDDITKRVMDVLKEFEKVDGVKVSIQTICLAGPRQGETEEIGLDRTEDPSMTNPVNSNLQITCNRIGHASNPDLNTSSTPYLSVFGDQLLNDQRLTHCYLCFDLE